LRTDVKSEIKKHTVFGLILGISTLEFTLPYVALEMLKGCLNVPVRALF